MGLIHSGISLCPGPPGYNFKERKESWSIFAFDEVRSKPLQLEVGTFSSLKSQGWMLLQLPLKPQGCKPLRTVVLCFSMHPTLSPCKFYPTSTLGEYFMMLIFYSILTFIFFAIDIVMDEEERCHFIQTAPLIDTTSNPLVFFFFFTKNKPSVRIASYHTEIFNKDHMSWKHALPTTPKN